MRIIKENLPKWDGIKRVENFFSDTLGIEKDLKSAKASYLFLQQIFELSKGEMPKIKLIPIIVGDQQSGKTLLLRKLIQSNFFEGGLIISQIDTSYHYKVTLNESSFNSKGKVLFVELEVPEIKEDKKDNITMFDLLNFVLLFDEKEKSRLPYGKKLESLKIKDEINIRLPYEKNVTTLENRAIPYFTTGNTDLNFPEGDISRVGNTHFVKLVCNKDNKKVDLTSDDFIDNYIPQVFSELLDSDENISERVKIFRQQPFDEYRKK